MNNLCSIYHNVKMEPPVHAGTDPYGGILYWHISLYYSCHTCLGSLIYDSMQYDLEVGCRYHAVPAPLDNAKEGSFLPGFQGIITDRYLRDNFTNHMDTFSKHGLIIIPMSVFVKVLWITKHLISTYFIYTPIYTHSIVIWKCAALTDILGP